MMKNVLASKKILCLVGTRPEAIKMAPLVMELRRNPAYHVRLVSSGQHRELVEDTLRGFALELDADCSVMSPNQTLESLTSRLFVSLGGLYKAEQPDLVIAQGDTTTVFVAAVVCFYQSIPFGHLEAGLRSGDLQSPFPEEMNRRVCSVMSSLHFAPTPIARDHLISEGVPSDRISVTGNTVIDALMAMARLSPRPPIEVGAGRRVVLLTAHRRENFGVPHARVFRAVIRLLDQFPDIEVIYPVHPNPNVESVARNVLSGHARVHLVAPMNYADLVATMQQSTIIMTDSGGIQEEAPALGKPVIVLRDETERPEIITAGAGILCGTDEEQIVRASARLLSDEHFYRAHVIGYSPVGDGFASRRVAEAVDGFFASSAQSEVRAGV
jgi:UDP-N-acetylglucosamine 2-epimerase (non-hydrolysing)